MLDKIIPGLMNTDFELFNINEESYFVHNGQMKPFSEAPFSLIQILKENIESDVKVKNILIDLHPLSEFNQIKQLAYCRFGGVDCTPDISNGKLQKGEYWKCPHSGNCKAEGVLCQDPIINGVKLSKLEVKLIQESTTDKTNEVIAGDLNMPMGTYHKFKNNIHKKLGNIQTKQALTKLAYQWNII